MNFKELFEGAEPKLPGAPKGVQIMTPQQFVSKNVGNDEPEQNEELDEDLRKWFKEKWVRFGPDGKIRGACARGDDSEGKPKCLPQAKAHALGKKGRKYAASKKRREDPNPERHGPAKNVATKKRSDENINEVTSPTQTGLYTGKLKYPSSEQEVVSMFSGKSGGDIAKELFLKPETGEKIAKHIALGKPENIRKVFSFLQHLKSNVDTMAPALESHHTQKCPECSGPMYDVSMINEKKDACYYKVKSRYKVWPSAYASGALVKCRKKGAKNWGTKSEGIEEATKLPAQTRPFGDDELTSYLDRIRAQQKLKTDKYKLPYIHRSSVIGYYNEEGKKYNVDAIKQALSERPKKLLKQNEKMKHSNGELEQFYNIGFAALTGIALDQDTNELIIVNTCPGAGSCKVDCFAMKGGKVQFQGPWLSDGRILTYLLNDPDGFFKQLDSEIKKEETKGDKGGYSVSIRWHDAGDFFSPEYADLAFKLARNNPDISFYAYTKVSDVAMGQKPGNFMINWSEGASSREEKKVKTADPELEKTKNSRIVPSDLFYDLLVKDEKKNLVKGPEGQWQVIPDKLPELKQRLAREYGISANSILSYTEWENKVKGQDKSPLKYNVIITPGEPDLTAKDPGVLSTLLLKH